MTFRLTGILLFLCLGLFGFSQSKFIIENKKGADKIRFKLINNLVVVPVEVNGVELSFLLDTGVSKPIIFNFLNVSDTLNIKETETIFLRGLGEGKMVEALKSKNNVFKIGEAIKLNQDLYAIFNADLDLSPRLGIPIHGIVGFDLFRDLVVEINYSTQRIRLTEPKKYKNKKCRKCETFNLEFYNGKPYVNAEVQIKGKNIPVKLLIDSGGSDALWLFENDKLGIESGDKYFYDFLGYGLNGSVYGKRSKVEKLSLKNFELKRANVAYPDSSSVIFAQQISNRNGSLSGNILKRFNVVFNYQKAMLRLKKNKFFRQGFTYNKSGIELAHDGIRFVKEPEAKGLKPRENMENRTKIILDTQYKLSLKPAYGIVEIRKGSPAEQAGLRIGDIIISINGKQTFQYSLQEIMQMFHDDTGKRIKLRVERKGNPLNFTFVLKDLFD
ncbi:PDZ domain-containing protein [Flavobacteriaceae bacterium GSB9]|nr:PDZ domain-containing protein [Flavobacteriaceae bacterium GSB9]